MATKTNDDLSAQINKEEEEEEVEEEEVEEEAAEDSEAGEDSDAGEDIEAAEDSEADASEADASDAEASDAEAEESDAEEGEASEADDADEAEGVSKNTKKTKVKNTGAKKVNHIAGIEKLAANSKKNAITNYDSDDESEEEPVNYLQKFDSKMRENFIVDHHPEARTHNYEEVKALARVSRDGRGIIIDPLHKTLPFLTKYEMTRVIGQRAKQLDHGAKAFVKVPLNVIDGYHIALLELEQKKMPFIIKRPYPNGGVEYWHVSDLEIL
jgi:DNA-directed RNA polymerase subunit K/omega